MRIALLCLFVVLCAAALLVLFGRARAAISLVAEANGLWLRIRLGLGPILLADIQFRWTPHRPPRLVVRGPFRRRFRPTPMPPWATPGPQWRQGLPMKAGSMLSLIRLLQLELLDVRIRLGLQDDASATALLCGALNAFFEALRAALTSRQPEAQGSINILPNFSKNHFSVRVRCIVALKIRHSIPVVYQSLTGRNSDERSSNRKHYANNHGKHTQHG